MLIRTDYSVINALSPVIEKWGKSFDEGCTFGALLTCLSKTSDCLHGRFLIAQLHTYGEDILSLKLLYLNLTKLKQINLLKLIWT